MKPNYAEMAKRVEAMTKEIDEWVEIVDTLHVIERGD